MAKKPRNDTRLNSTSGRPASRILLSAHREQARKRLRRVLSIADDEQFCRMIWAVWELQNGSPHLAEKFLVFPKEAAGADITSSYRVHPWVMETLVNELLTTPKAPQRIYKHNRVLNCGHLDALALAVNALNRLEEIETAAGAVREDIFVELHRTAQRQFHWQRGHFNKPNFYRSAYLFNFAEADALFIRNNGLSISDFVRCGFAIYAQISKEPFLRSTIDGSEIGISRQMLDAALRLLSKSHDGARADAQEMRSGIQATPYKPSVLRSHPCISFGKEPSRVYSPVKDLIIQRITTGLYYDLVTDDGSIRNRIADRFESYCRNLIQSYLEELELIPELTYNRGMNKTPDIILRRQGAILGAIECKAKKMTLEAKFSDRPLNSARVGYDEMVKAVIQLWRFFSHKRLDRVGLEGTLDPESVGVVLTLDSWMEMFGSMRRDIVWLAEERVKERYPEITELDRRPIVFCPIDDLEMTLPLASDDSLIATFRAAGSQPRFSGYHLSSVHTELFGETEEKPYPFLGSIAEVLPWWGQFKQGDNTEAV